MFKWLTRWRDQTALLRTLERENETLRSKLAVADLRAAKLEQRMKQIAELAK